MCLYMLEPEVAGEIGENTVYDNLDNIISDFINFLRGNFHQDIESVEDVIKEILDEESKEFLIYATKFISTFLKLDISLEYKINIISQNTAIYYEDKNQYLMLIKNTLNCINNKLKMEL